MNPKLSALVRPLRIDPTRSSWIAMVLASVLTAYGQAALVHAYSPNHMIVVLRYAHIALAAVILLVTIAWQKSWSRKRGGWLFFLLALPVYFISAKFHIDAARTGQVWVAFVGFKLYFLILSVLIAGPYWLNAVMIAGFALETFLIWHLLDLPHLPNAITTGEPVTTTLYAVVSISMLAFRVYHDHVAHELVAAQIRTETLEQMARIFLTLRDRSNTPIQTLEASAELLRRQYPEAERLSDVIQRAADRLSDTSDLLARLESQVAWTGDELMTDEEIRSWLTHMEHAGKEPRRPPRGPTTQA